MTHDSPHQINLQFIIGCYCILLENKTDPGLTDAKLHLQPFRIYSVYLIQGRNSGFSRHTFMSTAINSLYALLSPVASSGCWPYVLIGVLVALEGPITTLAGAVAASAGYLNPVLVFIAAAVGNLTADTLWYSLGYLGKIEWLTRYGGWFGVKESSVARLQKDIHAHIHKILFAAKLTLGFVIPTLIAAGLARVPFKRWFGALFAAECIWTGGLVLAGYYFGYLIQRIETDLRYISVGGAVLIIVLVIFYLAYHRPNIEKES